MTSPTPHPLWYYSENTRGLDISVAFSQHRFILLFRTPSQMLGMISHPRFSCIKAPICYATTPHPKMSINSWCDFNATSGCPEGLANLSRGSWWRSVDMDQAFQRLHLYHSLIRCMLINRDMRSQDRRKDKAPMVCPTSEGVRRPRVGICTSKLRHLPSHVNQRSLL